LKIRNAYKLEEKFWSVSDPDNPDYGKYMTLEEIASLIAPFESDIAVVRAWLVSNGITSIETVITKDYLTVVAPVGVVEKMFQVSIRYFKNTYHKNEVPLLRSTVPYSIPMELSSAIDIVFGLTNFPGARPSIRVSKRAASQVPNITPPIIKETLRIFNTTGSGRKNNVQSVIQFLSEYYSPSDLSSFLSQYDLPAPNVKVIGVNKPDYPGLESTLDIQYIIGTATGVETWFYEIGGQNSDGLFLQWLLLMSNQTSVPSVCSVSYGEGEDEVHPQYIAKTNVEFIKAGVRGITILFASGDSGTGCSTQCSQFIVSWPASSPYVTAVGGVYLANDNPLQAQGDSISGGGFSGMFKAPKYQEQAIANYLSSSTLPPSKYFNMTFNGRGVPDIAAYSENVIVTWMGSQIPVQGTSCAAPIAAGVIALINDALLASGKSTLGFFNPLLYKLAPLNSDAFFDLTEGSNELGCCPGFSCSTGWDAVTGWGLPMYDGLLAAVLKYFNGK
jgi:tripeptidyl-peptidase-1